MSALHEAVAQAIADAMGRPLRADEAGLAPSELAAADAAIRVVLAEARSVVRAEFATPGTRRAEQSHNHGIEAALAVLAALGEQA